MFSRASNFYVIRGGALKDRRLRENNVSNVFQW